MAVKVQHAHLTDTAVADTATVRFIVNTLYRLVPSQDYRYVWEQISAPKKKRKKKVVVVGHGLDRWGSEFVQNERKMGKMLTDNINIIKIVRLWEDYDEIEGHIEWWINAFIIE